MRVDHHAYQRGTRIAGIGFMVQAALGLTLLIFSVAGGDDLVEDTAFLYGAIFVLLGLLPWLGLIVLFNQNKLERLEALEYMEITGEGQEAAARSPESVFARQDDELRVAMRRLDLMDRWLMPGLSIVLASSLGVVAWLMLRHLGQVAGREAEFHMTAHIGWAVAICLAFTAGAFIFSRFVAGMAKQAAWQNLRGGAAFMVGNSLVTLAIAVGIGFQFFDNVKVIKTIAYAIPCFMILIAAEILLNFILNLYRPRIPGETPRPAFDSKLLSLLSAPDNFVRSINEAVNYQFGFDVASSWGYKLLIRSVTSLVALSVGVMLVLNMMVIVEPHQQAVKLSRGALVGDVHGSGIMWKLPWPLQTAEVHEVSVIRTLHVTSEDIVWRREAEEDGRVVRRLWTDKLGRQFDKPLDPFIVRPAGVSDAEAASGDSLARAISLIDAEILLQYRLQPDGGLRRFLQMPADTKTRPTNKLTARETTLRNIALREISQTFTTLSMDDVIGRRRSELPVRLRVAVQEAFDVAETGVDLVAVDLLLLRPAGEAAPAFEELSVSRQARSERISIEELKVVAGLTQLLGDYDTLDAVSAGIDTYDELRKVHGADHADTLAQRARVETMLVEAGGLAGQGITTAKRDRLVAWVDAGTQASRVLGQVGTYRAAPRLYRERATMAVYQSSLANLYKYVIGVDSDRVSVDLDLAELTTLFNIQDAIEDSEGGSP